MNITLDDIKATQTKLAEMIASFEAAAVSVFTLPQTSIELGAGERYAGLILAGDGKPSHHLILLPCEVEDINWEDAKTWAAKAGGELPTRQEQSLLFANLKSEFKSSWYWSGEQYSASGAWEQNFGYGGQYYDNKSGAGRARAVRRFPA